MTPLSFEDYCRTVRDADVQFILTRRATNPWWLYFVKTEALSVQFGSDGGASIADGAISSGNYVLIGRHLPSDAEILCNGELTGQQDLVLLPPNSRFIFAGSAARTWLAVTVPATTVQAICADQLADRRRASVLPLHSQAYQAFNCHCENLRNAATTGATPAEMLPFVLPLMETVRTILLETARAPRASADKLKALDIVVSALDAVRRCDSHEELYVQDLALAADVHPRTLLRAFHSVLRMGPVRYLRNRQLNNLRRQLWEGTNSTVTEAMHAVGANDMGRISGAYRDLFAETPSETLRSRRRTTAD